MSSLPPIKSAAIALLCFTPALYAIEISPPISSVAPRFEPDEVLLFGDSLSDSHGDSYGQAYSTFNLLRTLKGEWDTEESGEQHRPMELSEMIGRRATLDSLKYRFHLNQEEMLRDSSHGNLWDRAIGKVQAHIYQELGGLLLDIVEAIDRAETYVDKAILNTLNKVSKVIGKLNKRVKEGGAAASLLTSLKRQVEFLEKIVAKDLEDYMWDFTEEQLVSITTELGDMIPLIPDSEHYVRGKWTAGVELDKVWVEYLVKMMSTENHEVKLDNRAMAGSWILCAAAKVEERETLKETATSFTQGMMLLFQGSLIPPCEGLVVKSYLNQRRSQYFSEHQRYPELNQKIMSDKTLVVFFNGGNDFLNQWAEPSDVAQEHVNDVWNLLAAGARKVVVVTLPDISKTPRFKGTKDERKMAQLIRDYNTHLTTRLNDLRWRFGGDNHFQVITIHGDRMFEELLAEERWDVDEPLLDVQIPGMDVKEPLEEEAENTGNFVNTQLLANKAFDDNWKLTGRTKGSVVNRNVSTGKIAFFADSVHPSAEAHYAIAAKACETVQHYNLPCNPDNYSYQQARADSTQHNPGLRQKDEL